MRVASEDRSNAEWLRALRPPRRSGEAIEELRTFLRGALGRLVRTRGGVDESDLDDFTPVSYTHLTLPTIYSV